VAQRYLAHDRRVTFHHEDGAVFLQRSQGQLFDFIYADTWPGKFTHLPEALALLAPGGLYIIDDLLPQPSWPEGHAPKVPRLIAELESRIDLRVTKLCWATGLIIASKYDHVADKTLELTASRAGARVALAHLERSLTKVNKP